MFESVKSKLLKTPRPLVTAMSIIAAAQINYAIVHNSLVYIVLFVMLVHELGHYFIGKKNKADVKLPIFIPLPFFVAAFTKVSKLDPQATKQVSLYGPIFGAVITILLIMLNGIFNFTSYIPLFAILFNETILNLIGSDGKKYRKAKKEMLSCIS